ncbi:MAG: DNA polymerase III subunit gamma/tau [Verrucomicrobia bacterium]|nr:DNA polymerase III subunit gamma/tau [Verrucomicrobiota bacterium]
MSYQVIARKYRPQRFSDVVGQEHVTKTLSRAIEQKRIAHAYLFCGPRGTGKTTIARIFAKCLNCTDGPNVDFTDDDPRCQEITEGRSLDVMEIDGASNNGVEQVRDLRDTCRFAPASSRFKIYIIDEVHMLSTAAFNALLKTLEEPPAHVKFMFATTDPEKLLATVLSRCQRFDLRRIPVKLIVTHLGAIAGQENVVIEEAALHAIARGADGGMRDAESALDQLISFCGTKIAEADVLSMFGLTAQSQIVGLAQSLLNGDLAAVLRELDDLCKHGKELSRLLSDLLGHFRNVLIFQVSKGDLRLLETSEMETASLREQSATVSTDALTRIMEVLTEAESHLRGAASKKIFVEVALIKAIEARQAVSLDALLKQLAQMRAAAASVRPAAQPASAVASPPTPAILREAAPNPPPAAADGNLVLLWRDLVEAVGKASPFVRSYLLQAFPVSLSGKVLTIGFDPEFADQAGLVDNPKHHALITTKLHELGQPGLQVRFIVAEAPAGPAAPLEAPALAPVGGPSGAVPVQNAPVASTPPAARAFDPKDFKNDPLIAKALEIFKARIVDVRS